MIVLIYVQTIFHFQFCEWAAFVSLYYTFISGPLLRDLRLWLHSLIRLIFTSYNVLSIYTPCLKKTCQLLFALYLSTMNRFKWKLVGMFWNKHLIKQCINCPHPWSTCYHYLWKFEVTDPAVNAVLTCTF